VKRIFVKSSAGRQRHNVLGAVNAITQQIHFLSNQSYINAGVIIDFLAQLRNFYQDEKPIFIVLDNARYQKCEVVRYAAYFLNIHLIFLPPYSPNLHIIERLWKWVKKKCLYATFYESFQLFKHTIDQTLKNAHLNYKTEIDSLLNLKFQMFK
jgi:transposase